MWQLSKIDFTHTSSVWGLVWVRKWSPNWNANDPGLEIIPGGDHKWIRLNNKEWHGYGNGEIRELGWITIIFVETILNYGFQLASFGYFFHTTMLWMAPLFTINLKIMMVILFYKAINATYSSLTSYASMVYCSIFNKFCRPVQFHLGWLDYFWDNSPGQSVFLWQSEMLFRGEVAGHFNYFRWSKVLPLPRKAAKYFLVRLMPPWLVLFRQKIIESVSVQDKTPCDQDRFKQKTS